MATKETIEVALIEDNPDDAAVVRRHLGPRGDIPFRFNLHEAESLAAGLELLRSTPCQVLLLDLFLSDSRGLETYQRVSGAQPEIPVVLLTALPDEGIALEALRRGAQDYLMKGPAMSGPLLQRSLRYAVERGRWMARVKALSVIEAEVNERRKVDKLKDEFLTSVSHELRTPLSIIQAAIESLSQGADGPLPPKAMRFVELAQRNSQRLGKVINSLLELSRLESGQARLNRASVNLAQIVSDAAEGFRVKEVGRPLRIEEELAPGLPAVNADPDLAAQAVINLIDNAVRFAKSVVRISVRVAEPAVTPAGGAQGAARPAGPQVQVTVSDDGPGIAAEEQERLFDRFYQVQRVAKSDYKGTGLGLTITKQIIERHGGRVWVESAPGAGARFHFLLPASV
jgi:signal transduction histidine kinase